MDKETENIRLVMRCDALVPTPGMVLPPGYTLRYYEPGDEAQWLEIHRQADPYNVHRPGIFRRVFGTNDQVIKWRQLYLYNADDVAVGTVSGWYDDAKWFDAYWGRLHWLALLPEEQGKGLGDILVAACMQQMRQLGHTKAYLFTDIRRVPAVNLYLKYGFRPEVRTIQDEDIWRELAPRLKYPSFP